MKRGWCFFFAALSINLLMKRSRFNAFFSYRFGIQSVIMGKDYDSDASSISDDELNDVTDTNVMLGYAERNGEGIHDSISHLGGVPV